jgi:hypothetical protein
MDGIEYIDGAFRKNNPGMAAFQRARVHRMAVPNAERCHGGRLLCVWELADVPSMQRSTRALSEGLKSAQDSIRRCVQIAMNCHNLDQEVEGLFTRAHVADHYYRLDIYRGLESFAMNESDDETLQHIPGVAEAYLQRRHDGANFALLIRPRSSNKPPKPQFIVGAHIF